MYGTPRVPARLTATIIAGVTTTPGSTLATSSACVAFAFPVAPASSRARRINERLQARNWTPRFPRASTVNGAPARNVLAVAAFPCASLTPYFAPSPCLAHIASLRMNTSAPECVPTAHPTRPSGIW